MRCLQAASSRKPRWDRRTASARAQPAPATPPWPARRSRPPRSRRRPAVLAHLVAQGAQAVAVEPGAHPDAVGEDDAGRAVPRLHRAPSSSGRSRAGRGRGRGRSPTGLGHEHGHDVAGVARPARTSSSTAASSLPESESPVEHGPEQVLVAEADGLGAQLAPAAHAPLVAPQGVDLAVVAQGAEGLGPLPGRQGVGREPLVEDGERSGEALVVQVEVEVGQGVGGGEALVDHGAERARRDVGAVVAPRCAGAAGRRAARRSESAASAPVPSANSAWTTRGAVARAMSPSAPGSSGGSRQSTIVRPSSAAAASTAGPGVVAPHEQHGHPVALAEQRRAGSAPAAPSRRRCGRRRRRPPVLDARQAPEGGCDDGAGRPALGVGHEADPAGVELTGGGEALRSPPAGVVASRRPAPADGGSSHGPATELARRAWSQGRARDRGWIRVVAEAKRAPLPGPP